MNGKAKLDELYGDLLLRARELEKKRQSGEMICEYCDQPEGRHLHDKRCSTSCLSRNFLSRDQPEVDTIAKAIICAEELRSLLK